MSSTTSSPGLPTELPANAGRAATGVAIVLVAQLMLVLDATVVNVALPRIDTDLGFGPASLSWVLNSYTLAFGGLLLLGGRLGDVRGRLRLFEIGLTLFTVSSLLGGLAQTPGQLVAARALQGVGAALAAPSVLALLTTSAPDEAARNRAFALFGAVSSGGASIGLILGGLLTDVGSWRWTLFINVPLGIAVVLLARRFVDETPRRTGRFDLVGAATATLGAVSLVWALIGTPEHGWTSARTLGGFALGLALLAVLARTEARHPHPLVQPHLVRNRRRVGALAVMALVIGANLSMFFLVVQYVQRVLGFGPLASGFAFLPFSLGIFAMSRVTPWLIGRLGPRTMMMIGTAALVVGYAWLSGIGTTDTYLGAVFGPMLIAGLATGFVFMPITATVLGGVEPEHAGSASGLLQTTQQLGSAIGVAVIVSVYAAGAVPGAFVPGLQAAFLTSATFAALALVVSTVVLRPARRPAEAVAPTDPAESLAMADAA
ncbi:EmrB/QacA subfamily drug resistance transporter [Nocardioides ginsengisegetis]|uniref:EmrB/QacA subfamily drug resistance transporter n=1 Tax=Nocardioides ginsengisegetis TaxID=661491 RepID=A0A7W3P7W1_9ACTN|nr:MFS transporter [Nocardioides ginsengisegetis]MBA8801731.1 EmrB/QacA subfamily drug resistance transporter [Nocardioides ginsengisegetis]